jgi:NAD+ synthase
MTNYSLITKNIRRILKNYLVNNNIKTLVGGVSGGIDSATCFALAAPVCEQLNIPLRGRSITIESNKEDEVARAKAVGEAFCTDFKEVDFTDLYWDKVDTYESEEGPIDKIGRGNLKARTRMEYLYSIAGKHRGLVLSTDNKTEYYLGFWTLHGDVGDFGMIQNLWKKEVYELAEYLAVCTQYPNQREALLACVAAIPTDGLGISNSDLDQILPGWHEKYSDCRRAYEEVDRRLIGITETGYLVSNDPVFIKHKSTMYKRENPVNIPREDLFKYENK